MPNRVIKQHHGNIQLPLGFPTLESELISHLVDAILRAP